MEEKKDSTWLYFIVVPLIMLVAVFAVYASIAFMSWITTDPLHLIEDGRLEPASYEDTRTPWQKCVSNTKEIFDNFNDTVGASYALEDIPSQGAREFMEFCLERSQSK